MNAFLIVLGFVAIGFLFVSVATIVALIRESSRWRRAFETKDQISIQSLDYSSSSSRSAH